jgi:RNA polymerase sigma-70 factor (ECF subfamily)
MDDHEWLAERFEAQRPRLRAVAQRLLGSAGEADDAVQEAWLRLHRTDPDQVENLGGWLTTVVARVCLDMLRSRGARREQPLDAVAAPVVAARDRPGPEDQALVADAVGPAMLVVLDTLAPAERVAFVLHDLFAVPFSEIAPLVGRSPAGPGWSGGRRPWPPRPSASPRGPARPDRPWSTALLAWSWPSRGGRSWCCASPSPAT